MRATKAQVAEVTALFECADLASVSFRATGTEGGLLYVHVRDRHTSEHYLIDSTGNVTKPTLPVDWRGATASELDPDVAHALAEDCDDVYPDAEE